MRMSGGAPTETGSRSDEPVYSQAYLRYALGILCLVYVVNFVDRQILSILLKSIKADLGLTDVQLGLLSGTAFGLFYATLGIPIARLADRFSRKGVIAICLTIWSGMTALCGMAGGFASLLLFRVGVGIGEAGGSPPAHSMISDYFPPERRATALGIFSLGVPIGIMVGFMAGGWLDQTLGWRTAFMVVGVPGVLLAVVVATTLREPPRGHSEGLLSEGEAPKAWEVIRFLWRLRAFRHVSLGSALYAFVGYSVVTWAPSFLARSHQMSQAEIGTWLALIIGAGGGAGIYLGGVLSDRWAGIDIRGRVWLPSIAMFLGVPFSFVVYLASGKLMTLVALIVPSFLGLMYQAPAFAVTQSLATPKMRATAAAVLLFVVNIIGLAMGPAITGLISDALEPTYGVESLRYALLIVSIVLVGSGLHFWRAARFIDADLRFVRGASEREARGESVWGEVG
jgi:MFS family permease